MSRTGHHSLKNISNTLTAHKTRSLRSSSVASHSSTVQNAAVEPPSNRRLDIPPKHPTPKAKPNTGKNLPRAGNTAKGKKKMDVGSISKAGEIPNVPAKVSDASMTMGADHFLDASCNKFGTDENATTHAIVDDAQVHVAQDTDPRAHAETMGADKFLDALCNRFDTGDGDATIEAMVDDVQVHAAQDSDPAHTESVGADHFLDALCNKSGIDGNATTDATVDAQVHVAQGGDPGANDETETLSNKGDENFVEAIVDAHVDDGQPIVGDGTIASLEDQPTVGDGTSLPRQPISRDGTSGEAEMVPPLQVRAPLVVSKDKCVVLDLNGLL